MAIITSPLGTALAGGTDSARPRKGEGSPADPGFASLLALLVSGVAPALPPAGLGHQPPSESQRSQSALRAELPGSLPRPDLEQLTRSMMQAALDQMGPALPDGAAGPDSAEAVEETPGSSLAETASPGAVASLQPPRRPQLVLLPQPATRVERVVLGERPTSADPAETPGRIDPAAVPEAGDGPVFAIAEHSSFSHQAQEHSGFAAPPESEPARPEAPHGPGSEWVSASPTNQAVHAGHPPAEAANRAAVEPPPVLRHLAAQPVAPERLTAALREAAVGTEPGTYEITLRLSPDHLGEVRVTLQLTGSEVRTLMEVVGADARQALEAGADRLRQGLSQAGLTLTNFQVNTGLGGQQGRSPASEWPEWLRPPARRRSGLSSLTSAGAPILSVSPLTRTAGGRLDTLA